MTYVFTTLDYSGATGTAALGVDGHGDIVGYFVDSSGTQHGYEDNNGNLITIDFGPIVDTIAYNGISKSGIIVGDYYLGGNEFAFSSNLFSITTYLSSASEVLNANGINDKGWVVGDFFDGSTNHGLLITPTTLPKVLDDPSAGSIGTFAKGINNNGQIVGGYFDSSGAEHGFAYYNGKWTTLDDPLGYNTECEGINNKGQIVGIYFENGIEHGFVASKVNGKFVFTEVADPLGVKGTGAFGINNHGEIVGIYYDVAGVEHGFHT